MSMLVCDISYTYEDFEQRVIRTKIALALHFQEFH